MFGWLKAVKASVFAAGTTALVASNVAFAQATGGLDLAAAQAEVLGYVAIATSFVVAIGIAVLSFIMVAKAVKWARKAG